MLLGIAGLFLGCSILSGVEIVYFVLIISLKMAKKLMKKCESFFTVQSHHVHDSPQNQKNSQNNAEPRIIQVKTLNEMQFKKRTRY